MEAAFAELMINEEEEEILQFDFESSTETEVETFKLVVCFLTVSIIHFPAMKVHWPIFDIQLRWCKFVI